MLSLRNFGNWRAIESENNMNVAHNEKGELLNSEAVYMVYFMDEDLFGIIHKTLSGQGLVLVGFNENVVKAAYNKYIKEVDFC